MFSILRPCAVLLTGLALASPVLAAQDAPAAPPLAAPAPAPTPAKFAPAGTVVALATTIAVGSKISKRGDRFGIRLVSDLRLDGVVLLPAGALGEGEVTHAAPSKMGGGPGELMLAARFLDRDGVRVPLKAFKVGGSGKDNADSSLVVAMVAGPLALFVQGGEVTIPAGTIANAKLAADLAAPASISTSEKEKASSQ